MGEKFPYPTAEHYREPRDPLEVIDDELRLYPDARSMREGLVAIGRIYQNTEMLYCMKKYAYLVNVATIMTGAGPSKHGIDNDFYSGTILGTHALVKPAPKPLRQHVLSLDVLSGYSPWSEGFDPDSTILREILEELVEYRDGGWHELFEAQPLDHQERIMDMGARLYEDVRLPDERNRRWDSFASGYLYAVNLIYGEMTAE